MFFIYMVTYFHSTSLFVLVMCKLHKKQVLCELFIIWLWLQILGNDELLDALCLKDELLPCSEEYVYNHCVKYAFPVILFWAF
jgi:hypothetical protein